MQNNEKKEEYEKVKIALENAINKANNITIIGDEENIELQKVKETLQQRKDEFKEEIIKLEKSSEWKKLCIAFFGETNAGKSTIIEALRIIYDEKKRKQKIQEQTNKYNDLTNNFNNDFDKLTKNLDELYKILEKRKKNRFIQIIIKIGLVIFGAIIGFAITILILWLKK